MRPASNPIPGSTTRHAALLVLVMMVVSASPGLLREGVPGGGRQGSGIQDRIAQPTGKAGQEELSRTESRDEHQPTPAGAFRAFRPGYTDAVCAIGLPFSPKGEWEHADLRPRHSARLSIDLVAMPPPASAPHAA